MTGEYSYFTTFEEHDIMYHVSTLLPFSSDDRQQVLTYLLTYILASTFSCNLQNGPSLIYSSTLQELAAIAYLS
jgi:hypothetical protein